RKTVNIDDYGNFVMENNPELHPIDKGGHNIDDLLEYCIEKLKNEQKSCVRLFYFDNKCYRDIAARMGLEEKKVKSYLQNAKRNLKICMEENYEKE
ncbi:MAG TPA: sigma-70 region 4 domain-containing protein, partial [Bacteroidales bacterium]|nr:sigma-70 region 4 domain-containing protein [Bacteroidales bacterium]